MWLPTVEERGDCGFPPLVFLQLLFGRNTEAELHAVLPDVWSKDETDVLLQALFPKQSSCVYAVG